MENQRRPELTITLAPETLDVGAVEEKAAFGRIEVTANNHLLTEGIDAHLNEYRTGPLVSGYHLAEWLVWNWWRLRWEPERGNMDRQWEFAHRMSSIGQGYVWPNVTISSDGYRSVLFSEPSREPDAVPFRYVGSPKREVVAAQDLETSIDTIVRRILDRLAEKNVSGTNLHRLWHDLRRERENPEIACFRRLEAWLGCDPDEADEAEIHRRLDDAAELGPDAVEEIAAAAACRGVGPAGMLSADRIAEVADQRGFDANPDDGVGLTREADIPEWGTVEAWRVGAAVAWEIRRQEQFDAKPIDNASLANLAGTTAETISSKTKCSDDFSFVFNRNGRRIRVALRPKWETGRRFDLARLVGDRLFGRIGQLSPATRAHSYRQKAQRSFAAELLSPFEAVDEMLGNDDSEEKQTEVAEYYAVSPMTIQTLLVNNGRLARERFSLGFD